VGHLDLAINQEDFMGKMCKMRFLRIEYEITLRELANAAGVSVQYVSEIELQESCRTKKAERLMQKAFEAVISKRGENTKDLKKAFFASRNSLFSIMEAENV
jgi:transcriptional regulator with XRE-family HTH domain